MKLRILTLDQIKEEDAYPLKYWSNACGDLHHHGEYDITEQDLPEPLKRCYLDLWGEDYGSLCYLVESKDGYGIALINEYDKCFADDCGLSMDDLFMFTMADAFVVSKCELFSEASVYAAEYCGFDDSHELIVVFPPYISKDSFQKAADVLYNGLAYKSAKNAAKTRKSKDEMTKLFKRSVITSNASYIDLYIEYGRSIPLDDSEIIETLLETYTRSELEEYGYGEFIKAYFDAEG